MMTSLNNGVQRVTPAMVSLFPAVP